MSTPIERFLYADGPVPGIVAFALEPGSIRVRLSPWEGTAPRAEAYFADVRITVLKVSSDPSDDLNLPWGVIGFDCREVGDGRREFCLHGDVIDLVFESRWPTVSRGEGAPGPEVRP